MASRKLSQHTAITGANVNPNADYIEILDVSDTTDAASGTNKKILPSELPAAMGLTPTVTELNYVDGVTSAIQTQLDAKASSSALSTEASTRAADDTTLAGLITTEASARSSADSTLQSNINSEASTRSTADSTLQTNIDAKEASANKDATGGYVGLTLFKINFKNALNTFTSFFTNANTAARTYTFPDYDSTIATVAGTETLTNKRLTARVQSVTSSATVTPNADTDDLVIITAQAASLVIANPTGTPTEGQALLIRIKDNGTARAISFGSEYRAIGITLPTTTVLSKTMYLGCVRNVADTKWDVIGLSQEA